MPRIRTLKPEMLSDERTAALSSEAWRLFVSMILLADDYGNLHANARHLAAEAFWAVAVDLDMRALLGALEQAELVQFYRVRDQSYVHLRGWEKHQKVDHPGRHVVPPPSEEMPASTPGPVIHTPVEVLHARRATDSRDSRETLAPDRDREGDREGDRESRARRRARSPDPLYESVLEKHRTAWQARYRADYVATPADRSQLGRLIHAWGPARSAALPAAIERYLADASPFLVHEVRHSLSFFCTQANKYAAPLVPAFSAKEHRSALAAQQFLAMGGGARDGPE